MTNRASVVFAIQNWLGESQEAKKTSSQPAYFSVGMACEWLPPVYHSRGNVDFWNISHGTRCCKSLHRTVSPLSTDDTTRLISRCSYLLHKSQDKVLAQKLLLQQLLLRCIDKVMVCV